MSFFDEVDEPPTETRAAPRSSPRQAVRRRGSGGGSGSGGRGSGGNRGGRGSGPRRTGPRDHQQSIMMRRAIAAGVIIVVIILIAIGVNSCESSARKSALQDYANNVSALITRSDANSSKLFATLTSGASSSNAQSIENQINQTLSSARDVLDNARALSVPDAAKSANTDLVLALRMRADGIENVAGQIQPALGSSVNRDAVDAIAAQMARFYASDVLYKQYAATSLAGALHGAGIGVGGTNGVTINPGQFLPDVQWTRPDFVAQQLHVNVANGGGTSGKPAAGLHGHTLNSVSVGGTTLQSGATNTLSAKPAPTFTLNFTNGGDNDETNVVCKVTVTGAGVSGSKTVPQTIAGKTSSCAVTLTAAPAAGTYNVVATIQKVPGEKNTDNNTLSFPVTFQ